MKILIPTLLISTLLFGVAAAQDAPKMHAKQSNLDRQGLAIKGYDPVAYFTADKAEEGKKDIALTVDGVTYLFATPHNLELFKSNPGKYQPQYGGWCAYAMGATGEKVDIDPGTFKIVDGKLYLFYNQLFNNTKKSWNKDEKNLQARADLNWQKFISGH